MEAAGTSVCLVMKAVLLSARWAGRTRQLGLEQAATASGDSAGVLSENVTLRDTVEFLTERLACAERRLKAAGIRKPYSLAERLHILWRVEYFGIPRRPHTTLAGAVPDLVHAGQTWQAPARTTKTVPASIQRRFFPETRVTGFRLAA